MSLAQKVYIYIHIYIWREREKDVMIIYTYIEILETQDIVHTPRHKQTLHDKTNGCSHIPEFASQFLVCILKFRSGTDLS